MDGILAKAVTSGKLDHVTCHKPVAWRSLDRELVLTYFEWTCAEGHLQVAQWMHNVFNLRIGELRRDNCHTLSLAKSRGHLRMTQWLVNTFNLTLSDIKCCDPYPLYNSCLTGRVDFTQWLIAKYGLSLEDEGGINNAFAEVCVRGHTNMARWLYDVHKPELPSSASSYLIARAHSRSNLGLVQLLCK